MQQAPDIGLESVCKLLRAFGGIGWGGVGAFIDRIAGIKDQVRPPIIQRPGFEVFQMLYVMPTPRAVDKLDHILLRRPGYAPIAKPATVKASNGDARAGMRGRTTHLQSFLVDGFSQGGGAERLAREKRSGDQFVLFAGGEN